MSQSDDDSVAVRPEIWIFDDDQPVLASLTRLLRPVAEVLAIRTSLQLAWYVDEERPDGCVIDMFEGAELVGVDLISHAQLRWGLEVPIVSITGQSCRQLRDDATARGILSIEKPIDSRFLFGHLIRAAATLARSRTHLSRFETLRTIKRCHTNISDLDLEVLFALASTDSQKVAAELLDVSVRPVEDHAIRVRAATGMERTAELVAIVQRASGRPRRSDHSCAVCENKARREARSSRTRR